MGRHPGTSETGQLPACREEEPRSGRRGPGSGAAHGMTLDVAPSMQNMETTTVNASDDREYNLAMPGMPNP